MSNPMNLTIPTVGTTVGPDYANEVNDDLSAISSHRHVQGEGNPVPTAGIDINADLPANGFNLTEARSVRLNSQSAPLALGTDTNCWSSVDGEATWNDGNGVPVQITADGALNASAVGGFTNLAGTTGAATYNSGAGTFTLTSATNHKAALKAGPVSIADVATSARSITLKSPTSLASDIDITLPAALPASQATLEISSAGVISSYVLSTPIVSLSCGTFSTMSGTYVNVTNLAGTMTTSGRPVVIMLIGDGSSAPGVSMSDTVDLSAAGFMQVAVSGSATTAFLANSWSASGTPTFTASFPGAPGIVAIYPASAGTYTFTAQAHVTIGGNVTLNISHMKLAVYEL